MAEELTHENLIRKIKKLEEKDKIYRQLFDTDMVGIYRTRLKDGKFLAANRTLANMMGYRSIEKFMSDFVTSKRYVVPSHRQELMTLLDKNGKVDGFETKMKRADGAIIQIALSGTAYPDKGYSEGVIIDITDRKKTEAALKYSEQRYRTISEITSDYAYAFRVDADDTIVNEWATGALSRVTGYTKEELKLKGGWAHLVHPEDIAITQEQLNILMSNQKKAVEYRIITKDGHVRWMHDYARPVWSDEKNRVVRIEGAVRDITNRKRTAEALRVSHIRFLTVLNSIDATIYVADLNTYEILFMNKHMIDSYGRDMTGEVCWRAFRDQSEPCQHCTNDRLVDKNGQPTGVHVWQGKNPVIGKWYSNYDRAIEWTDGRLARLQIATDITDLKKMEKELHQANKMEAIGTLAGGIAHNFNNLLMGILGRASLMSTDLESSDPLYEHIEAINEYSRSAVDLTNQLLGFVRGGKYEVTPIDLNELLQGSAEMFERTRKEIQIHTKTGPERLVIEADRSQIEQVLLNLYVNAWQAMPGGGELFLETSIVSMDEKICKLHQMEKGHYAKISVTDTGIGMDEDTQQQIFDPFFTTKDRGRGTGLGLASAYGIIKNHGGIIFVDSKINMGSTFNIYLPASKAKLISKTKPENLMIKGTETILLIDDETMILEVAQAMLEKLGYTVMVAGSGPEAIEVVQKNGTRINLVILDMIMPMMDGGKTFEKIREIQPEIPVILSSGYTIDGKATEILAKGCNGFIQKPFNMAGLSQKVQQILNEARSSSD